MKRSGAPHIDLDAQMFLERQLQVRDIEEAGAGWGVDEDVEVAALDVVAVEGGAEEARVGHAGFEDDSADSFAVLGEDVGRLHGGIL